MPQCASIFEYLRNAITLLYSEKKPTLSSSAMQILETTFVTAGYLFVENMRFTEDYRLATSIVCNYQ